MALYLDDDLLAADTSYCSDGRRNEGEGVFERSLWRSVQLRPVSSPKSTIQNTVVCSGLPPAFSACSPESTTAATLSCRDLSLGAAQSR